MPVTISSFTFDFSRAGLTGYLRFYADSEFYDPDGVFHPAQAAGGQDYLKQVAFTVASNRATVPSFTLPATWDEASGARSSLTAYIFDSTGRKVGVLVSNFRIPSLPSSTTWGALLDHNVNAASIRDTSTYTKAQTNYQIEQAALSGGPATTLTLGRAAASVAPVNAAFPIFVGDNDPRLGKITTLGGFPVSDVAPAAGQFWGFDGTEWLPTSIALPSFTSTGQILIGADTDGGGGDGVLVQTRSVTRLTIANDGLITFDDTNPGVVFAGGYSEHYGSASLLHRTSPGPTERPPLIGHGTGTSGQVPVLVNHFFDCTSAPGGQFGTVVQLRAGGVEGLGATPALYGNFKVAFSASIENTPGIETDALLHGQTIIAQINPGPALRPICYGFEIDINNLHSAPAFGETDYPAQAVVGAQIINGGTYRAHRGLTFAAIGVNNQIRRGVVVEESAMFDCAIQLGAFTRLAVDGGACGVVARNYGGDSVSFWVERLDDTGTAGGLAFKVSGHNGTDLFQIGSDGGTIGPWFRATNGEGFYIHKDDGFGGSPSKAVAYSTAVPGAPVGDDIVLSTYSSTGTANWRERLRILNQSDVIQFMGTQILTTRRTGWATNPTGTLARTTFDSTTVTLADLAARVAALITDLRAHGLIGA